MTDKIEKRIELNAPIARVWRALIDHKEFGNWFCAKFEKPFVVGQTLEAQSTYPGYEHFTFEITVKKIEPERLFSYTWHPYAVDLEHDYSEETPTLVEFKLEKIKTGTLLIVTETGFDNIPSERRLEAFRKNDHGWSEQLENINKYVAKEPENG